MSIQSEAAPDYIVKQSTTPEHGLVRPRWCKHYKLQPAHMAMVAEHMDSLLTDESILT